MAKRCGTRNNPCNHPRANWWKQSIGVDWFNQGSGGGETLSYTLSKLSVKYNNTNFPYLTEKTGLAASFNAGANPLGAVTFDAFNAGVAYDLNTDEIISAYGTSVVRFTRDAYFTAAAAALGTEPVFSATIGPNFNTHGLAYDPINNRYFSSEGNKNVDILNSAGTVTATFTVSAVNQFSQLAYDWTTQILYTTESTANGRVQGVKETSPGTWTLVYDSDFVSADGVGIDYIRNKMAVHHADRVIIQGEDGTDVVFLMPYPVTGWSQEGLWIDEMDGKIWHAFPLETAGGAADTDVLVCQDPRGWYRKYFRNHMFNWSQWKHAGNNAVTGQFHEEVLTGSDWSTGPVIDYGANTEQQNINNWEISEGDAAELEFRGSATAPTTVAEDIKEYLQLPIYDPTGTNDGWGDTVPGAWQSTPTTDRYMQVRVKPISPTPVSTPSPLDLGSKLLAWFSTEATVDGETNEYVGMNFDPLGIGGTANQIPLLRNIKDPSRTSNFTNTSGFRPLLISGYASMVGANRHLIGDADLLTLFSSLGACEIHVVGAKDVDTTRAVYFFLGNTASNNSNCTLEHIANGGTPSNMIMFRFADGAGAISQYGIVDTLGTTPRLLSFIFGDTNSIQINLVPQTLTVDSGSNTGQKLSGLSSPNTVRTGRRQASTSVQGATRLWDLVVTQPLTDSERETFIYDYFVSKGKI